MSITASPELVTLCQSQLVLLNRAFGAVSAMIYLAEATAHSDQPTFTPIASYPESFEAWPQQWNPASGSMLRALPISALAPRASADGPVPPASAAAVIEDARPEDSSRPEGKAQLPDNSLGESVRTGAGRAENALKASRIGPDAAFEAHPSQQLVLPLIYNDRVVGMLVTVRHDRPWQPEERHELQSVACGIAAGCFLEQRQQWLYQRLQAKRALQGRQSEVFHNLLHQFRNPLTALGTFGKLLLRRLRPDDPNYAIADNIVRQGKRLQALIEDFNQTVDLGDADLQADVRAARSVLPAAEAAVPVVGAEPAPPSPELRQDTQQPPAAESDLPRATQLLPAKGLGRPLTLTVQSLPVLLAPLISVTQAVAQDKPVDFWVDLQSAAPAVLADRQALQEVVANLLDNAVKYSPPGARVWLQIGCRQLSGMTYAGIAVGDTGPGIPPEDQPQLFQRHYRGVQTAGPIAGTGLGLAIAQDLMTQMQGTIEVFSPAATAPWPTPPLNADGQPAGPGTVFMVWLPQAPEPAG